LQRETAEVEDIERPYTEVSEVQWRTEVPAVLQDWLADYNGEDSSVKLPLVLFETAIEHLLRILRVLRYGSEGHLILVGVDGSGRRSLIRLACHIRGSSLFHPDGEASAISSPLDDFRLVLKKAMMRAGMDGRKTVLLCEDSHFKTDAIANDLQHLMSSTATIPDLWNAEEQKDIVDSLLRKAGITPSKVGRLNFGKFWLSLISYQS